MKRNMCIAVFVILCSLAHAVRAVVVGGPTTMPVTQAYWPAGAVDVANLPSRIGKYSGPILAFTRFDYVGDTAAFQRALDALAKIQAPRLELIIHDGPNVSSMMKARIDWELTLWRPTEPLPANGPDPNDEDAQYAAPRFDVYIGGGQIDWAAVKVPANISVTDERQKKIP